MDNKRVEQYRAWFSRFVQEHATGNEQDQQNILLKKTHTDGVCANALQIAAGSIWTRPRPPLPGSLPSFTTWKVSPVCPLPDL